jgi:spore maturation protein CgeB
MKIVVFGLAVSSSWGNGHATLWRGLLGALAAMGHDLTFYERDVPYYARHRDLSSPVGWSLHLYGEWSTVAARAAADIAGADVAIVTSYCPDALPATDRILDGRALRVFYDLDTGMTLERLAAGDPVPYLGPHRLAGFDLVLSYTGGGALEDLRSVLGARHVVPLYGSVDPEVHLPGSFRDTYRADLSYLGTYAPDRHAAVEQLFLEPARRAPDRRFVVGGPLYPEDLRLSPNVSLHEHVPPQDHPAFYGSSRFTLNATRAAMARHGYCPSGRLFEAAACGTPVISDRWRGLESFFTPGEEILVAGSAEDTLAALELSEAERRRLATRARERTLDEHTARHRGRELVAALERLQRREPLGRSRPLAEEQQP